MSRTSCRPGIASGSRSRTCTCVSTRSTCSSSRPRFFASYQLQPHIDTAFAPRFELPLRDPELSLTPRIREVNAGGGWDHTLKVQGGPDRAGQIYIVLVGGSGITPGLPSSPRIPLNFDAWTNLGLAALNTPCLRPVPRPLEQERQRRGEDAGAGEPVAADTRLATELHGADADAGQLRDELDLHAPRHALVEVGVVPRLQPLWDMGGTRPRTEPAIRARGPEQRGLSQPCRESG